MAESPPPRWLFAEPLSRGVAWGYVASSLVLWALWLSSIPRVFDLVFGSGLEGWEKVGLVVLFLLVPWGAAYLGNTARSAFHQQKGWPRLARYGQPSAVVGDIVRDWLTGPTRLITLTSGLRRATQVAITPSWLVLYVEGWDRSFGLPNPHNALQQVVHFPDLIQAESKQGQRGTVAVLVDRHGVEVKLRGKESAVASALTLVREHAQGALAPPLQK